MQRNPPTLPLLAIESATDALSVAVLGAEGVLAYAEDAGLRRHSSALLPLIDATLRRTGLDLGGLAAMAIASGPGSFTSLRIGLATLKGLAFGRAIPVVGVSTLEVMAAAALAQAGSGAEVLALLDARRGQWYAGAWRTRAGAGTPGEDALALATLAEGLYSPAGLARDLPRSVIGVCPDESDARGDCERAGLRFTAFVDGVAARPRADWVGRIAAVRLARGEGGPAAELRARYLRRAEAEALRTGQAVEAGERERGGDPGGNGR